MGTDSLFYDEGKRAVMEVEVEGVVVVVIVVDVVAVVVSVVLVV